jgi:hypothetical protein
LIHSLTVFIHQFNPGAGYGAGTTFAALEAKTRRNGDKILERSVVDQGFTGQTLVKHWSNTILKRCVSCGYLSRHALAGVVAGGEGRDC